MLSRIASEDYWCYLNICIFFFNFECELNPLRFYVRIRIDESWVEEILNKTYNCLHNRPREKTLFLGLSNFYISEKKQFRLVSFLFKMFFF